MFEVSGSMNGIYCFGAFVAVVGWEVLCIGNRKGTCRLWECMGALMRRRR